MPAKSNKSSEIVDQSEMSCQEQCYFFYDDVLMMQCGTSIRESFLIRKTSNGTKHLMEIPIFKLPHHQRVFNN